MPEFSRDSSSPRASGMRSRSGRRQPPVWGATAAGLSVAGCILVVGLMAILALVPVELPPWLGWIEGVACVAVAGTTWAILLRRLPLQNVVGGGLMLLGLVTLVTALSAKVGVPLGGIEYTDALGPRLLGLVPVGLPFLWMSLLLLGRETARVALRPWRRDKFYGYYLVTATSLLVVLAALSLDPFAVVARSWWLWPDFVGPAWYGAPWGNFLVWLFAGALMITLATPWLLPKRPIPTPLTWHAPLLWLLLVAWFTAGNLRHGLWLAGLIGLVTLIAVGAFTWGGWQVGQQPLKPEDESAEDA